MTVQSYRQVTLVDQAGNPVTVTSGALNTTTGGGGAGSNITQWNGNTIQTGNGTTGTGTLRVTLSSDSTGQVALAAGSASIGTVVLGAGSASVGTVVLGAGSATIGALTANQSVNLAQVGGSSTLTGNGVSAGAIRVSLSSDSTGQVTLAAGSQSIGTVVLGAGVASVGTVILGAGAATIGSLAANQSVNTAQVGGNATAVGNGTTSTGTQRVTISSDSTGQVALAAGAATIGSLAANQSVNVAQMNGVATTMGNGVTGTGVQRVTISSDSTGQVTLAAGAATIGALTANQSVNVAQVNGNATSTGNGTTSTGTQRVTISSDSTGQVALASGTTIQAIPATSGGLTMYHAVVPNNTTGVVVKNSAGQIYGIRLSNTGTAAGVLHLYNSSSAPTAGAGTVVSALIAPGPAAGGGGAVYSQPLGLAFSTGIAYTFTTGIADTDTGTPAASTYSIDIDYK